MAGLPLAKLGALLIKTVAKPVAAQLKRQAADHEAFRNMCVKFGRFVNNVTTQINVRLMGHKPLELKPLAENVAVSKGTDLLGEIFVFSVGGGIVIWEYNRQRIKADKLKVEKVERQRIKESLRQLRFEQIEDDIKLLVAKIDQLEDTITRSKR